MEINSFRLHYSYSKFWLIFWFILLFPIGLVLLSRAAYSSKGKRVFWKYEGNRFWLHFWAIFLSPIALLLFFLKGTLIEEVL
jgi:hypothetical protein